MDSQKLKLVVDKYAKYDSMRAKGVPINLVRRLMMVDGLKSAEIKNYVETNTKCLPKTTLSQHRTKRQEFVSYNSARGASPISNDSAVGNSQCRSGHLGTFEEQTCEAKPEQLHQSSELSEGERERLQRKGLQQSEYEKAKSTHHAALGNMFIRRNSLVERFMRKKSSGSIASTLSPNHSISQSTKSNSNSQHRSHSQSSLDQKESLGNSFTLPSPMQQKTQFLRNSNYGLTSCKKPIRSEEGRPTMQNSSVFSSVDLRVNKLKSSSTVARDANLSSIPKNSKKPTTSASLRISISTASEQNNDEEPNKDHYQNQGVEPWFTPNGIRDRSTSDHSTASLSPSSVCSPSNLFTYFSPKAYLGSSTDPKPITPQQGINSSTQNYLESHFQNSLKLLRQFATSITSTRSWTPKKDSPKLVSSGAKASNNQKRKLEKPLPRTSSFADEGHNSRLQKCPANQNHTDTIGPSTPDIIDFSSPLVATHTDRPFLSIINPYANTLASTYLSPPSPSHLAVTGVGHTIQIAPIEIDINSDTVELSTSQIRNTTIATTPSENSILLASPMKQLTEMELIWQSVDRIIKAGRDSAHLQGINQPSTTSSSYIGIGRERTHHCTSKAGRDQNVVHRQEIQINPLQVSVIRDSRLKAGKLPHQDSLDFNP